MIIDGKWNDRIYWLPGHLSLKDIQNMLKKTWLKKWLETLSEMTCCFCRFYKLSLFLRFPSWGQTREFLAKPCQRPAKLSWDPQDPSAAWNQACPRWLPVCGEAVGEVPAASACAMAVGIASASVLWFYWSSLCVCLAPGKTRITLEGILELSGEFDGKTREARCLAEDSVLKRMLIFVPVCSVAPWTASDIFGFELGILVKSLHENVLFAVFWFR